MVRLLEREAELEVLSRAAEDAVAGRGSVVLVGGEAGIGKTALVRSLRASASREITFLSGACEPLSVPVPLAPIRELVDDACDRGDPASTDRIALARSILEALGSRAPVVALVEDAHWADPLTVEFLRILARRIEDSGVALVITYRNDEVAVNPQLELMLGDLASSPAVRRIALNPLSDAAVRELASGSGLDGAELLGATGGNPFLVVEAIAAGGGLPASVRDAALARVGRLGRAARQVVDVAAVIGWRFETPILEQLLGDCLEAVEEALARGVLVADGAALGFRHELIREALEQSISPPRRAALHARVFAALAQAPQAVDSARLAHHAELGGLPAEAARYALLASAEAERMGALREMGAQSERALRFASELEPQERFELLLRLSRALNFSSLRLDDAVTAAERAVEVADELADPVRRGRALVALAWAQWSPERVIEARQAAERAIAALQTTSDAGQLARAQSALIRMEATAFDPAAAVSLGPEAIELAGRAGLEEVRLDVEISVALARGHLGEPESISTLWRVLEEARSRRLSVQMVRTYVNLITTAVSLRDHALVDRATAEALPALEDFQTPIPAAAITVFRARSLLDRGRLEEAHAGLSGVDPMLKGESAVSGAFAALIRARRGDTQARQEIEHGWRRLREIVAAESSRHGMVRLALVEAAWLAEDDAAALEHLGAARDSPATCRFARSGGELALWAWRYGVELAPPARAPAPVRLELEGDWRAAIQAWRELEAPYESALAALPGDDRAAREALTTLRRLGAEGAARAFSRERAARGARPARGPRRSTLANRAGLTRREQEVLNQLATGASNAEIAVALHLSERTVGHHVSAILAKLGVANRHLAVDHARRSGLVAKPR